VFNLFHFFSVRLLSVKELTTEYMRLQ
jgi:hypothetical protein